MSELQVAFVCVQNAGRSQMAAAFAEQEAAERGLEDHVTILSGGTNPADAVHTPVVEAMNEVDIDISERVPRKITTDELESCDFVATMGCSSLVLDPAIERRNWDLPDPAGQDLSRVREI
ncbi:MAG: low molecular weight phosphatase family protein, partial [Salinirussus sp.]